MEVINMRYHINYDGKILPCRAKVKACPYGDSRHGDSYEDLYYKFQDKFNNVSASDKVINRLKAGEPLHGVKDFDEDIANSDSPMELICSTYKQAINDVGSRSLNEKEQREWENAVEMIRMQLDAGQGVPDSLPTSLKNEGNEAFMRNHSHSSLFGLRKRMQGTDGNWRELVDNAPYLTRLAKKHDSNYQMTKNEITNYRNVVKEEFNVYANYLNTRKLLAQPMITASDTQTIQNDLSKLSDKELLSIYDDFTVSDKEIRKKLDEVNHFNFSPISQLSPAANANLAKWFKSAREAEKRYIVGSSRRTLLALTSAQVLYDRNKNYGDLIYTVMEK